MLLGADVLHVRDLSVPGPWVTDPGPIDARLGADLSGLVESLLRAAARSQLGARLDRGVGVDARLDAHVRTLERLVDAAELGVKVVLLAALARARLPSAAREALLAVADEICRVLPQGDHQLRDAVQARAACGAQHLHEQVGGLVRGQLRGPEEDAEWETPLRLHVREASALVSGQLHDHVQACRVLLDRPTGDCKTGAEGRPRSYDYHQAALAAVAHVARRLGDAVQPTVGAPGLVEGCEVGGLVTVADLAGEDVRLVAVARDASWSPSAWRRELGLGRANRRADGALAVVPDWNHVPCATGSFCTLDGAGAVVAWRPGEPLDALAVAYRLVRVTAAARLIQHVPEEREEAAAELEALASLPRLGRSVSVSGPSVRRAARATLQSLRGAAADRPA